jgi:hypothetical protein
MDHGAMMNREDYEAWADKQDLSQDCQYNFGWRAWVESRKLVIQRIQAAASEPVLLPGAIVLPGDFFAKVK